MHSYNQVDLFIVIALLGYIYLHMKSGVFVLTRRLVGFIGGAIVAYFMYGYLSRAVSPYVHFKPGVLDAVSFIVVFVLLQWVIKQLLRKVFECFPRSLHMSKLSEYLAIVPACVDGLILISLTLFLLVVAPFFISAKGPIESSKLGSSLVNKASGIEVYLDHVFGKATESTLGFMTVEPEDGGSVALPFKATDLSTDPQAETEMLRLVNIERVNAGVEPLVVDETLITVARLHSKDMWQRQYFAHTNLDGLDPFDRMRNGGATFGTAGENLALARTTLRAHEGLMNSPGHKRNILDPNFKRVGIGVVDGGVFGKMFTQDFSD
jgi:uncharacterized protein YkwD